MSRKGWGVLCVAALSSLIAAVNVPPVNADLTPLSTPKPSGISVVATPKFMTLPYTDSTVYIAEGWICHWDVTTCTQFYGSLTHGGIDYVKSSGGTWVGFDVVAPAEGLAYCSTHSVYGNYVIIEHTGAGAGYYSYYAHLASCDAGLPLNTPVQVVRGQRLGFSGESGSAQGRGIHLHFTVCNGSRSKCQFPPNGYVPFPSQMTDPYDITNTYLYYPPNGTLGANYIFTSDPPQFSYVLVPVGQNLVRNADFSAGTEQWSFAMPGEIDYLVQNSVLHFMRRADSTHYASVRQDLNYRADNNSPFEVSLDLGNSSDVVKQVSVVILPMAQTGSFGCDFTLAPHSPLQRYTVRGKAGSEFPNIRLEVYAQPADSIPDIMMDNVSVQYRPDISPNGTECLVPMSKIYLPLIRQ